MQLCGAATQPIDLVVTDVHLPDENGREVARQMRERMPHVRVMFMTGGPDTVCSLEKEGRFPVLAKPFTTADLVRAVRGALAAD
jgi:DNA-binding NtrC family response regulator